VSVGLALLAVLAGCNRTGAPNSGGSSKPPPPNSQQLEETEPHAAGKKVFNANGCVRCHTITSAHLGQPMPPRGGPGGPEKGPDLSEVAAKPDRDVEWFIACVSDPRKEKPESRMPAFGPRIKPEDMRALAEFLADLK
jgi:mono/diheme cytochrome c family protein